jgi:bifunctional non-homologous end joining protein LigD
MPHIINRPLSLLRCPEGSEKECFFQKHLGELTLKHVEKLHIPGNDNGAYLVVRDIRGLIELVQMGVIEFHTWGSTTEAIHQPDRMIFDLDPDPAVPWSRVIEGAKLVEYLLSNLGLQSYLKTTGGKGLHVVVPIKPDHDFAVIKEFSKSIASHLAETIPSHFVAVMSKAKRKDKIFIDYLRNGEEATAIAAFSVRAREGGPISVPIRWDELSEDLPSNFYNVRNIFDRLLQSHDDPWQNYTQQQQIISDDMLHTFDH